MNEVITGSYNGGVMSIKLLPDGYTLIFLTEFGSRLYGTDTEKSDYDFKGVFVPSLRDMLLNSYPNCITYNTSNGKNCPDDMDVQLVSIHEFIRLLCLGDTMAIDILHADTKPDSVLITTEYWEMITHHRSEFYTSNFKAYLGYAKNQAYMYGMKGKKLKCVEAILQVIDSHPDCEALESIWSELPVTEHSKFIEPNDNGVEQYTVCGKVIQKSTTTKYSRDIIQRLADRYGNRSIEAMNNDGVDWKALSHALRACYEVIEILENKSLQFPLQFSRLLLEVKNGEHDYKYIVNLLEEMIEAIDDTIKYSNLRKSVDREFAKNLTLDIITKSIGISF